MGGVRSHSNALSKSALSNAALAQLATFTANQPYPSSLPMHPRQLYTPLYSFLKSLQPIPDPLDPLPLPPATILPDPRSPLPLDFLESIWQHLPPVQAEGTLCPSRHGQN